MEKRLDGKWQPETSEEVSAQVESLGSKSLGAVSREGVEELFSEQLNRGGLFPLLRLHVRHEQ